MLFVEIQINEEMMIKIITKKLLEATSNKAKESSRLRMNHNFHEDLNDPVNRMLNALEPDTYLRPHRHQTPPKDEVYIVLEGDLDVLIFDDCGNIIQRENLNPQKGKYGVDIPAGVWHSMIVNKSGTVIYEAKAGPFAPLLSEDFASWSPDPEDEEQIRNFFEKYSR